MRTVGVVTGRGWTENLASLFMILLLSLSTSSVQQAEHLQLYGKRFELVLTD